MMILILKYQKNCKYYYLYNFTFSLDKLLSYSVSLLSITSGYIWKINPGLVQVQITVKCTEDLYIIL